MISFKSENAGGGNSIFDLVSEKYPDFSVKALKSAFKKRLVTLNGEETCGDEEVRSGDMVRIYLTGDLLGAPLAPDIIYQDENIVIIDKPAGLPSVSVNGEVSAVSLVEEIMKQRGEYSLQALMVPYMVYPLDRYVSGLMILAKHEGVYLFMAEAIFQRRITRYFVCPVAGDPKDNAELLAYHKTDKTKNSVRILSSYHKGAKPIVTRYSKLSSAEGLSLLYARPITNYLHQVRAHLAFEGLPVIGDNVYGDKSINRKCKADNIALWLKTLIFETGTSHEYAYLNGKKFESHNNSFPKCVYDAGLLKTD